MRKIADEDANLDGRLCPSTDPLLPRFKLAHCVAFSAVDQA
jgi:hypothetical protein